MFETQKLNSYMQNANWCLHHGYWNGLVREAAIISMFTFFSPPIVEEQIRDFNNQYTAHVAPGGCGPTTWQVRHRQSFSGLKTCATSQPFFLADWVLCGMKICRFSFQSGKRGSGKVMAEGQKSTLQLTQGGKRQL